MTLSSDWICLSIIKSTIKFKRFLVGNIIHFTQTIILNATENWIKKCFCHPKSSTVGLYVCYDGEQDIRGWGRGVCWSGSTVQPRRRGVALAVRARACPGHLSVCLSVCCLLRTVNTRSLAPRQLVRSSVGSLTTSPLVETTSSHLQHAG